MLTTSKRIDSFLQTIREKMVDKDQATLDELSKGLDIDLMELGSFQQLKNQAMMEGKLTQDEAQQVYSWLGETPDHFNSQPLEIKVLVTKMMGELLKVR